MEECKLCNGRGILDKPFGSITSGFYTTCPYCTASLPLTPIKDTNVWPALIILLLLYHIVIGLVLWALLRPVIAHAAPVPQRPRLTEEIIVGTWKGTYDQDHKWDTTVIFDRYGMYWQITHYHEGGHVIYTGGWKLIDGKLHVTESNNCTWTLRLKGDGICLDGLAPWQRLCLRKVHK